jgi:hypothetical protein
VRLPALLVFPLIAFIMPSLFIVLMGPAMMRLLDMLHSSVPKLGGWIWLVLGLLFDLSC